MTNKPTPRFTPQQQLERLNERLTREVAFRDETERLMNGCTHWAMRARFRELLEPSKARIKRYEAQIAKLEAQTTGAHHDRQD